MTEEIPIAAVRARRVSTAWLVPICAVLVIITMVVLDWRAQRGPMVVVRFADAAGLAQGDRVVHLGLTVGVVRELRLTPDFEGVDARIELAPHAESMAREGTEFWIVRPELSLQRVSGLETLLGPGYIAARPGQEGGARRIEFVGLDQPPAIGPPKPGSLRVRLHADRLGGLAPGSPVLYRDIPVGAVRSALLRDDATGVVVTVDIEPGYTTLVRQNSRFWRTGGVGLDFGLFTGLSVRADSLDSVITAGVALATPNKAGEPAGANSVFDLADSPDGDWLEWTPVMPLGQDAGG